MTRIVVAVLIVLALCTSGARGAPQPLLVTVGDVTATSAVVWVRAPGASEVTLVLTPVGGAPRPPEVAVAHPATDLTVKFAVADLRPRTRYHYRLESDGDLVTGRFVTAPTPDDPVPLTFTWSGDLGGGGHCRPVDGGYPIFRRMEARAGDFFLFVGDTTYADQRCSRTGVVSGAETPAADLAGFRTKHRYHRLDPAFQGFLRTRAVWAIWDDHDVKNNFDRTEPLMPLGLRAFLEYWPIVPPPEEPTRLYRGFRWGKLVEVFILDTRQYRSPNVAPDGPGKTLLGATQRRWLVEGVTGSSATWKVIVSSVSLSIPTGRPGRRDSWSNASAFGVPQDGAGFASERDAILDDLRKGGVRNLLFLVTDVHHAEIIRHRPAPGLVLHELVAGPLAASTGRPRALDSGLNPVTLFARGEVRNFGEIAVEPASLTVRMVDEGGTVMFTHVLKPE
jgi:alkaline phosphatase D